MCLRKDIPHWAEGIEVRLERLSEQIEKTQHQLIEISKNQRRIMALVQIEQSDLDTAAAAIETIATAISNIPSGTLAAADESALNKAISDAQTALSSKNPPPATA